MLLGSRLKVNDYVASLGHRRWTQNDLSFWAEKANATGTLFLLRCSSKTRCQRGLSYRRLFRQNMLHLLRLMLRGPCSYLSNSFQHWLWAEVSRSKIATISLPECSARCCSCSLKNARVWLGDIVNCWGELLLLQDLIWFHFGEQFAQLCALNFTQSHSLTCVWTLCCLMIIDLSEATVLDTHCILSTQR